MSRTLDELGERLFVGRTAEVYAWSDTEVIKLYQPWVSEDTADRKGPARRRLWTWGSLFLKLATSSAWTDDLGWFSSTSGASR